MSPPVLSASFYALFDNCKNTVGFMASTESNLKVIDGDPSMIECTRLQNLVSCNIYFFDESDKPNESPSKTIEYEVLTDTGSDLSIKGVKVSELMLFNREKNLALMTSGIVDMNYPTRYIGSKVCTGKYFTQFEIDSLADE